MPALFTYQKFAEDRHFQHTGDVIPIHFYALGLAEEAGEFVGKVKKEIRGDYSWNDPGRRKAAALELGDVMWYLTNAAAALGYSLEDIMQMNIDKLTDRRARGVTRGDGDNR